jgi:hypothetical protein
LNKAKVSTSISDANLLSPPSSTTGAGQARSVKRKWANIPLYVLKGNTPPQIRQLLSSLYPPNRTEEPGHLKSALGEADAAVNQGMGFAFSAMILVVVGMFIAALFLRKMGKVV